MVRRYLAALLLLATPALAAVELDGDSNGAIDVAKGGTNATTAAGARTALGVQPLDSDLTSIAGMATTAWGRGLLDDADAAAGRTSLGIAPADTLNVAGVDLGTGSATTGLLRFYGNTKAFSFGIFSQGADGLGVGWRLPSTNPAATSLLTVDSSGYMAYLDPSAVPVTASGFNGNLATTDDTLQEVAQKVDDLVISGADTPSYPSAAGVANWNGSAWGTSYTVGTAANNLVQLNASAQLPAVSADLLTITDTGSYFTTDTVGAALQQLGGQDELLFGTDFTETAGAGTVTITLDNPVTVEAWSGSGWSGDTQGATRDDIYDHLHIGDTDDDGKADVLDLASAGIVKVDSSGVPAIATAGTDYMTSTNLATGSTDNAILRANGTGGSTAQASGVTIDDNDNLSTSGTLSGKMATVVNSDTASYSVTTAHARAGTLFLTTNAATTTYTLPAAEAGMTACFSMGQGNSQILRIDTDGTDYIVMSTRARTGTAGDYYGATASATNKVCVAAYDATDWYVESEVGTWAVE